MSTAKIYEKSEAMLDNSIVRRARSKTGAGVGVTIIKKNSSLRAPPDPTLGRCGRPPRGKDYMDAGTKAVGVSFRPNYPTAPQDRNRTSRRGDTERNTVEWRGGERDLQSGA